MNRLKTILSIFAFVMALTAALASPILLDHTPGYQFIAAQGGNPAQCVFRGDCHDGGNIDCTYNTGSGLVNLRQHTNPTLVCGVDLRRNP